MTPLPSLLIEYIELGRQNFPNCSDPSCDLDASVWLTEGKNAKKPWCTGHAHIEVAMFMVGL
jgi:hypothetical protein